MPAATETGFPKPTLTQRFFASAAHTFGLLGVGALLGGLLAVVFLRQQNALSWAPGSISLIVATVALGMVCGIPLGAMYLSVLCQPLFRYRARFNGAPFQIGQPVMVISGKHCGKIGSVVKSLSDRRQYCIDFPSAEKLERRLILSDLNLMARPAGIA